MAGTNERYPPLTLRKEPKQARSVELVAVVLDAAAKVLAEEGAARFTSARVAERAGVSVGSLYQYFPNKAAILFRLQTDEWQQTTGLLREILQDRGVPPLDRLRRAVHAFVRSECEEAQMRGALKDAAPLYRDSDEARARPPGYRIMEAFLEEAFPAASETARSMASDLIARTLGSVGKGFSELPRADDEITSYAEAMADMITAYLGRLDPATRPARRRPKT